MGIQYTDSTYVGNHSHWNLPYLLNAKTLVIFANFINLSIIFSFSFNYACAFKIFILLFSHPHFKMAEHVQMVPQLEMAQLRDF